MTSMPPPVAASRRWNSSRKTGIDVAAVANLAHREARLRFADQPRRSATGRWRASRGRSRRLILRARPPDRRSTGRPAGTSSFSSAAVLRVVVRRVVAVGGLGGVDVPVRRAEALGDDPRHLLERGRDDRAAGLGGVEERLLVHLLGRVGVADEDDLDVPVAALQEDVEQREEPLGEILHVLGHRAGDVHQAEHHRLRHGPRRGLVPPVAQVDRVDVGNAAAALVERRQCFAQQRQPVRVVARLSPAARSRPRSPARLVGLRALQRDAARQAVAHGARAARGWRASPATE